jgi:hypothetical protein
MMKKTMILRAIQTATPTATCRLNGDPDMKSLIFPVNELMVVVDNCFIHIIVVDAFSLAGMLTLLGVRLMLYNGHLNHRIVS